VPDEKSIEAQSGATVESEPLTRWYALQVYSGHENKVKTLLERRVVENTNPQVIIRQVLVPTQEVMEIKGGKKTKVRKNLYPGYILVEALMNDETQYFINSISGIIKFLGAGATPQPLREREVNKILGRIEEVREAPEIETIPFDVGDSVEVVEGPFSDFSGVVEEVYHEKGKVKVTVSLFGRPTAVELDYLQLKKVG
jgi:transcription termination/antitermination protein NusG